MALFGIGKKKPAMERKSEERRVQLTPHPSVLIRPRITEKAANATARGIYTFDVRVDATKRDIAEAVQAVYRVKPVAVRTVMRPAGRKRLRNRRGFGRIAASKKAYVYLKEGDRIEFSA